MYMIYIYIYIYIYISGLDYSELQLLTGSGYILHFS